VREREEKREIVIGIGCKAVEDNGNSQEVSCTVRVLLYFLVEPRTFLVICPRCKLVLEDTALFKLRSNYCD